MKIYVSDNWLSVVEAEVFVVGSIGVNHVEFVFDESWAGYSARAIFEMPGTTPIEVPLLDFNCEVPWEALADVKKRFRIGIYGQKGDIRRPTLWTDYFPVSPGASEGVAARPAPTPDVYEQLVEAINQAGSAKDHAARAEAARALARKFADDAAASAERAEELVSVGGVQSDWAENDETSLAFVKNRVGGYMAGVPEEVMADTRMIFTKVSSTTTVYKATKALEFAPAMYYIVTVDGRSYTLRRCSESEEVYGNGSLYDPVAYAGSTGSVCLHIAPHEDGTTGKYTIYKLAMGSIVTVAITRVVGTPVPFPPEFLPESNIIDTDNGGARFKSATSAEGLNAFAEGYGTTASGDYSHAEGEASVASGKRSHAEGNTTTASGINAHSEGNGTVASGNRSHVEGNESQATGDDSHAEGVFTFAVGEASHAEGCGTRAESDNQHTQGRYNVADAADTYAHIVGNGTNDVRRSNAHTVDWGGNAWFAGEVYVGSSSGTNRDGGSQRLAKAPKVVTVTLLAAAWDPDGLTQTVGAPGVTVGNLVTPAPKPDSWVEAGNCGVYASAQNEDALTFTCRVVPAADLTYTVVIQEV